MKACCIVSGELPLNGGKLIFWWNVKLHSRELLEIWRFVLYWSPSWCYARWSLPSNSCALRRPGRPSRSLRCPLAICSRPFWSCGYIVGPAQSQHWIVGADHHLAHSLHHRFSPLFSDWSQISGIGAILKTSTKSGHILVQSIIGMVLHISWIYIYMLKWRWP